MFDLRTIFSMETLQNFSFQYVDIPVYAVIHKYFLECHLYQKMHHANHRVDPHFVVVLYSFPENNHYQLHVKNQGIGKMDTNAMSEVLIYVDYLKKVIFEQPEFRTRLLLRNTQFHILNEIESNRNSV